MKNTLQSMRRQDLMKLYSALRTEEKFNAKWTTEELIDKILENASEDHIEYLLNVNKTLDLINDNQLEIVQRQKSYDELKNEARTKAKRELMELAANEKRKAMELVMVNIVPNDPRDQHEEINCVTISVCNAMGVDVTRVIPFNIWCEVERCIAKQARDLKYYKYFSYHPNKANKNELGHTLLVNKYNVIIKEKKEYFKEHNIPFNN